MKTAISIPDALFDAAEQFARRAGISRSELYQRALAGYLTASSREAVTEALNEAYSDPTASKLDEQLEKLQTRSIPDEDWD